MTHIFVNDLYLFSSEPGTKLCDLWYLIYPPTNVINYLVRAGNLSLTLIPLTKRS